MKRSLTLAAGVAAFILPAITPLAAVAQDGDGGRERARAERRAERQATPRAERPRAERPAQAAPSGGEQRQQPRVARPERTPEQRQQRRENRQERRESRPEQRQERQEQRQERRENRQERRADRPAVPQTPLDQRWRQGRREDRQEWRSDRRDDRQEWRQERREDRQENRPDNRNDRQEWRQDRRDDRQEWRQDRRQDGREWRSERREDRRDYREFRQRFDRDQWRRDWNRRHSHGWWRNDHRWRGYSGVRIGFYFAPSYGYYSVPSSYYGRRWSEGQYLPSIFWRYRLDDWRTYGLGYPPEGTRWVLVDNQIYLIDEYDGYIIDVIYDAWRW